MLADIDHDGDNDLIAGNLGTNTQFKVSQQEPLVTYAGDFDNNGTTDPLMTWYIQHSSYPFNSRDEIVEQLPMLNKKFLRYAQYAKATINEILNKEQIEKAAKFYIYETKTSLFINNHGKFEIKKLPMESQFSMMNAILFKDYDNDSVEDILMAGNFMPFRVQQGPCDANFGLLLKGNGKGEFKTERRENTNLYVPGDVRDMLELKTNNGSIIVVSKNGDAVQVLKPLK